MADLREQTSFLNDPWIDEQGRSRHTPKTADRATVKKVAERHDISASAEKSQNTQIKGTKHTYNRLENFLQHGESIIDFGSGKGAGARLLRKQGYDVTTFEPFPNNPLVEPDIRDPSNLTEGAFDVLIASMVLNVLPQDERDRAVEHINRLLKPGGRAYLTVRSDTKNDVPGLGASEQNIKLGAAEYIVGQSGAYQYGFSATQKGSELGQYLRDLLPACQTEKINAGKRGVLLRKG